MSKPQKLTALGALLFLLFFFSLPDLWLWKTIDKGQEPLRLYTGDSLNYVGKVHAALLERGPVPNTTFVEHHEEPSQFAIFQILVGTLAGPILAPLALPWVILILKLFVVLGVFVGLFRLLQLYEVPFETNIAATTSFMFIYGTAAFQGYALGNWLLPFLLLGVLMIAEGTRALQNEKDIQGGSLLALSLLPFSFHPIMFGLGVVGSLSSWFFTRNFRFKESDIYFLTGWLFTAGVLYSTLFLPFMVGVPAGQDALYRILAQDFRLPIHPLTTFLSLTVFALSIKKGREDSEKRWLWVTVGSLALGIVAGVNVNVFIGKYVVGDHYVVIDDFLAPLFLALCLFVTRKRTPSDKIGAPVLLLAVNLVFIAILNYLNFRFGYFGHFAPRILGYILASAALFSEESTRILRTWATNRVFLSIVVAISFLYGSFIFRQDTLARVKNHAEIQNYRELIETFRSLPAGVIFANSTISETVSLYTPNRTYWSRRGFSESVLTADLHYRWLNEQLFFPKDETASGPSALLTVYGNFNRCKVYRFEQYLEIWARLGFTYPKELLCGKYEWRNSLLPELLDDAREYNSMVNRQRKWKPIFEIDYLVLQENEEPRYPWLLKDFSLTKTLRDGTRIYTYTK